MSGSLQSVEAAVQVCRYACQLKAAARHKMEYTTPASRTALRMIVVTPATSRMESCRGSNAMLVLLVPAERQH